MLWTTLTPLMGVILGGLVSLGAQHSVRRASERAEARRGVHELTEARRSERITHLVAFLSAAQEAERVAVERYHHKMDDEQWQSRAKETIDRVWVTQKTIHLLCTSEVNEAARGLAFAVQKVVRDGPDDRGDPQDEKIWEFIRPDRRTFLDIVRDDLT